MCPEESGAAGERQHWRAVLICKMKLGLVHQAGLLPTETEKGTDTQEDRQKARARERERERDTDKQRKIGRSIDGYVRNSILGGNRSMEGIAPGPSIMG